MTDSGSRFAGFRGTLRTDEPMSRHTSLRVGGPADLYAIPEDLEDLLLLVSRLDREQIPRMVIGGGYNLLVRDGGVRGAVISLERLNRVTEAETGCITAWAGAENLQVVRFGQRLGLGGVGFIAGIPGTIGGAVRMNAGAYGNGLLDHAVSLTLLQGGVMQQVPRERIRYGYRHLELQADDIVLAITLQLKPTDPELTEEEIRTDLALRRDKHNVGFPSAGSFFKNPPGQAAWQLIDAAGMRGAMVGGAQMSELHSNFLVNRGTATAADCLALMERVRKAVMQRTGVMLEPEVRIVGEEA